MPSPGKVRPPRSGQPLQTAIGVLSGYRRTGKSKIAQNAIPEKYMAGIRVIARPQGLGTLPLRLKVHIEGGILRGKTKLASNYLVASASRNRLG